MTIGSLIARDNQATSARDSDPSASQWLDWLSRAAIAALVVALALGFFVPLYSDEVAIKFVQSRFLAENGRMISLFPQCAQGFVLDTPVSWYPAALLHALVYADLKPLGVRIAGITVALAWLATLLAWARMGNSNRRHGLHAAALCTALLGLGVMPLTLALSRPEQWLIWLITLYLVLPPLAASALPANWATNSALTGAFLLLTSLMSFSHPKALFFVPLVIASAWYTFARRSRTLVGLSIAATLLCAVQSLQFTRNVTQCEQAPILARIMRAQTTDPALMVDAPITFLREIAGQAAAAPGKIAGHTRFQNRYQSGWLPASPDTESESLNGVRFVNGIITAALYGGFLLAVLAPPLLLLTRGRKTSGASYPLLTAGLWLGMLGHAALYKEWNFYSGSVIFAIAGLLLVQAARLLPANPQITRTGRIMLASLLGLSIISTCALVYQLGPRLLELSRFNSEYLPDQQYSVNVFSFEAIRPRIRTLADKCALETDRAARLVVDDMTYFAFNNLTEPIHLAFLWPGGWGADISGRTRAFLLSKGSSGIIAQCTFLSREFRYLTTRDGNLCCVNLADY